MRNAALALCFAVVVACTRSAGAVDAVFADGFEPNRWIQGYYVGYQRDLYPVAAIDFAAVTHLMIGRMRPLA
ncbi:MAG TPA: hypothetical protein VFS55_08725, partial [Dokdonella sp.]|nr:hypothetical protein [Dokdonella sp.]